MAKKTPDPMKRDLPDGWYFKIEYYAPATIEREDRDTLVCRRVGNKPVNVKFNRYCDNWRVELRVYMSLEATPDNWFAYHTGIEVTDAVIDFWESLVSRSSHKDAWERCRLFKELEQMFVKV